MAAATGAFDLTESVLGYIRRDVVCAVCIGRMKLPPTRTDAREKAALFFGMAHALHMRKRPPLCTWRAPLTWGGARLAGESASIRECPCLRRIACSGAVVRPACGSARHRCTGALREGAPIRWQSYHPACVFGGMLCAVCGRYSPGKENRTRKGGQKGRCPVLGSCFGGLVLRSLPLWRNSSAQAA